MAQHLHSSTSGSGVPSRTRTAAARSAALDAIGAPPCDDIRYYDTPLYCYLIATDAQQAQYHALSFEKAAVSAAGNRPANASETASSASFLETDALAASHAAAGLSYRTTTYSAAEAHSLMRMLGEQPGVRVGRFVAILGCVRFLEGYYVVGVLDRRLAATIGVHRVFQVGSVHLLPLTIEAQRLQVLYQQTTGASSTTRSRAPGPSGSGSGSFDGPLPMAAMAASYLASAVATSSSVLYSRRSHEERYREQFLSLHATRSFFYSHSYDLTNTLQVNMATPPETTVTVYPEPGGSFGDDDDDDDAAAGSELAFHALSDHSSGGGGEAVTMTVPRRRRMKYVWNEHLLEPFTSPELTMEAADSATSTASDDADDEEDDGEWAADDTPSFSSEAFAGVWAVFMTRGAVVQRRVHCSDSRRTLLLTLIARVSKEFAGARYLRRGVSSDGRVANHVEVEQILFDAGTLSRHFTTGAFSSYVQVRGSVPVRWYHPPGTSMPKPPIIVAEGDVFHNATCLHFQELLLDYGAPIVATDLMKQRDRHRREAGLGDAYRQAVGTLRGYVTAGAASADSVLRYRDIDLRALAGGAWNAVTAAAELDAPDIGLFACAATGAVLHTQRGVVRTNCVDCIDRTNIGQYMFSLAALGRQLCALGLVDSPVDVVTHSHSLAELLLEMYLELGDAVATQYGGSAQVGAGVLHRGRGWDHVMGIKRLYANLMGDTTKQQALSLYLGRFQPSDGGEGDGHLRRSRACNRHLRYVTTAPTARPGRGAQPLMAGLAALSLTASMVDFSDHFGEEEGDGDEHGDSNAPLDGAPRPAGQDPAAETASQGGFLQRLRAAGASVLGRTAPAGAPGAAAPQREKRGKVTGGAAEPDYYLHVRGRPVLPSPAVPRRWWVAALASHEESMAAAPALDSEDDNSTEGGREDSRREEMRLSKIALGERDLCVHPADADRGWRLSEDGHGAEAANPAPAGVHGVLVQTVTATSGRPVRRQPHRWDGLASACTLCQGTPQAHLSSPHCGANTDSTALPWTRPVAQTEFLHDGGAFPAAVTNSVHARSKQRLLVAALLEEDPERTDRGRLLIGQALLSRLGPLADWTSSTVCDALKWIHPSVSSAVLERVAAENISGSCLDLLSAVAAPEADEDGVEQLLAVVSAVHAGGEKAAAPMEHPHQPHRLSDTVAFLEPFLLDSIDETSVSDAVRRWRDCNLLDPVTGVPHTDHYRFTDQFPANTVNTASATPPVPMAMVVDSCFSAHTLHTWLLSGSAAKGLALLDANVFPSAAEASDAAWSLCWWLIVSGIIRPVAAGRGYSAAEAWELLADPAMLYRVASCELPLNALESLHAHSSGGAPSASPAALAESLCGAALSALSAVLSLPAADATQFAEMAGSLAKALEQGAATLRACDVAELSARESLPFWVNLFNALYVHAWLRASVPWANRDPRMVLDESPGEFMKRNAYLIGPHFFSLHTIKYGILCSNKAAATDLLPPFSDAVFLNGLHHLTPAELTQSSATAQAASTTLTAFVILAGELHRTHVEDHVPSACDTGASSAFTTDPPFQKIKYAMEVAHETIRGDNVRFLLRRVLLSLMDVYLPPPVLGSNAVVSGVSPAALHEPAAESRAAIATRTYLQIMSEASHTERRPVVVTAQGGPRSGRDAWSCVDLSMVEASPDRHAGPRRVRSSVFLRLTTGPAAAAQGARQTVPVAHLCATLLAAGWRAQLLQTERSYRFTLLSPLPRAGVAALVRPLLSGYPTALTEEASPLSTPAALARHLQDSLRSGRAAGEASAIFAALSQPAAASGWSEWRQTLASFVDGLNRGASGRTRSLTPPRQNTAPPLRASSATNASLLTFTAAARR